MIDGIKIYAPIRPNIPVPINTRIKVDSDTGAVLSTFAESYADTLYCRFFPQTPPFTNINIYGSLHTYYKGNNNDIYTFNDLKVTIQNLEKQIPIYSASAEIQRLEIGVNIRCPFPAKVILNNAICYKGKPFRDFINTKTKLNLKGVRLNDYTIKLYIKDAYTLRFELAFTRARPIQKVGIYYLSDLCTPSHYIALADMLRNTLNLCFFFDFRTFWRKHISRYSKADQTRLLNYCNPQYWENLSTSGRQRALKIAPTILARNGLYNYGKFIREKTTKILLKMIPQQAEFLGTFSTKKEQSKQNQEGTFSNLECLYTNVPNDSAGTFGGQSPKEGVQPSIKSCIKKTTIQRRFCVVCGREITHQKNNSRFCSEKFFGKSAKKCRNKESNRRLTLRRKIQRAIERKKNIEITYKENKIKIQHPRKLKTTKENLNKIFTINIIEKPPNTKSNKK